MQGASPNTSWPRHSNVKSWEVVWSLQWQ